MHSFTVQDLQDLAVRCTTQFLTNQTSLNSSLAKEAADLGLNSEQVKRAVEATNTLAYLKNLEKSASERTVEFPLADYTEIIRLASMPEALLKEATAPVAEAVVESKFEVAFPELTTKEAMIGLHKEASINDRALEDAVAHSNVVRDQLIKSAATLAKDPLALDKLSAVVEADAFEKIARLVFKEDKVKRDTVPSMFKEADLKSSKDIAALYKQACDLVFDIARRTELQKKANAIFEVEKQAGLGSAVGGMAGKALGSLTRLAAKGIMAPPVAAIRGGAKAGWNAVAKTGVGKALAMTPKTQTMGGKLAVMGVVGGAGAALDASMYKPKQNPTTGNGGDVWNKLHNND